jgi:hypothetical protein
MDYNLVSVAQQLFMAVVAAVRVTVELKAVAD